MKQVYVLYDDRYRVKARQAITLADLGSVVTIEGPKRSLDQNAKLWAMLTDISEAQPHGIAQPPDVWKCSFMVACGHEIRTAKGINGETFPLGVKSSALTVKEMADLITFIYAWADEQGVDLP